MKKLNVTTGEAFTDGRHIMVDKISQHTNVGHSVIVAEVANSGTGEAEANAELFTDSLNTHNKCGKLPSELLEEVNDFDFHRREYRSTIEMLHTTVEQKLEERNELVEALKEIMRFKSALNVGVKALASPDNFKTALTVAEALLTKIENNQTPQPNL